MSILQQIVNTLSPLSPLWWGSASWVWSILLQILSSWFSLFQGFYPCLVITVSLYCCSHLCISHDHIPNIVFSFVFCHETSNLPHSKPVSHYSEMLLFKHNYCTICLSQKETPFLVEVIALWTFSRQFLFKQLYFPNIFSPLLITKTICYFQGTSWAKI